MCSAVLLFYVFPLFRLFSSLFDDVFLDVRCPFQLSFLYRPLVRRLDIHSSSFASFSGLLRKVRGD